MKNKPTFKLIISETTAVAVNLIPLALWFFEDYSVATVVVLYALESVLAMVLAVFCVLILAPAEERRDSSAAAGSGVETRVKSRVVKDFLLVAGMGTVIVLVFPATFIFLFGKGGGVSVAGVKFGLCLIVGFQLFEFFANLYLLRPLSLKEGEFLLSFSFGGIALLLVSFFLGVFLAVFFNVSPFLPFIVLKTISDLAQPIQYFTGRHRQAPDRPVFKDVAVKSRTKFWSR